MYTHWWTICFCGWSEFFNFKVCIGFSTIRFKQFYKAVSHSSIIGYSSVRRMYRSQTLQNTTDISYKSRQLTLVTCIKDITLHSVTGRVCPLLTAKIGCVICSCPLSVHELREKIILVTWSKTAQWDKCITIQRYPSVHERWDPNPQSLISIRFFSISFL